MAEKHYTVGLVGARGYVGAELLRLVANHPRLNLAFASSRQLDGKPLSALASDLPDAPRFERLEAPEVAKRASDGLDILVLALPNGLAPEYVRAVDEEDCGCAIIDLSSDHRFDDHWSYGLVEHHRQQLRGHKRIANPGCYATAAQVALKPFSAFIDGPANIFGVSGYSGAGTTPSPKNDPEQLADNLMPYKLAGHIHEREISRYLGRQVCFMPHVAPFFRGITLTINVPLNQTLTEAQLFEHASRFYDEEALIAVQQDIPLVRDAAGKHIVTLGGFTASTGRAVIVATIDNLLKGAATQALQNINLSLGLPERQGLPG